MQLRVILDEHPQQPRGHDRRKRIGEIRNSSGIVASRE
jgi:hypothetical protein